MAAAASAAGVQPASSSSSSTSPSSSTPPLRYTSISSLPTIYLVRHGESYFNARERYFKNYKQIQLQNPNEIGPGQDARLVDSELTGKFPFVTWKLIHSFVVSLLCI